MLVGYMDDGFLRTEADKLFELVKEKKTIKSADAAEELGRDLEKAIMLAQILEEDNLIKLHYPPIGEPFFVYIDSAAKKMQEEEKEEKPPAKSRRGQIKVAGIVAALTFLMFSIAYKNNPELFGTFSMYSISDIYLDMNSILIIATIFAILIIFIMAFSLRMKKRRISNGKGKRKHGKGKEAIEKWKEILRLKRKKKSAWERLFGAGK